MLVLVLLNRRRRRLIMSQSISRSQLVPQRQLLHRTSTSPHLSPLLRKVLTMWAVRQARNPLTAIQSKENRQQAVAVSPRSKRVRATRGKRPRVALGRQEGCLQRRRRMVVRMRQITREVRVRLEASLRSHRIYLRHQWRKNSRSSSRVSISHRRLLLSRVIRLESSSLLLRSSMIRLTRWTRITWGKKKECKGRMTLLSGRMRSQMTPCSSLKMIITTRKK